MAPPRNLTELVPYADKDTIHAGWRQYLVEAGIVVSNIAWVPTSVIYNLSRATADAIGNMYDWVVEARAGQPGLLKQVFKTTAEGSALDLHALDAGTERHDATYAQVVVTLTRADGYTDPILIPAQVIVSAASLTDGTKTVRFMADVALADRLWTSGATRDITVVAEAPGTLYNVAIGAITTLLTAITGVASITNADYALVPGEDAESDSSLRERLLGEADDGFLPSDARYKALALSVTGILDATVIAPSARGPNAVDITVAVSAGAPSVAVKETVLAYVKANAASTDDVVVYGAAPVYVSIAATITIKRAAWPTLDRTALAAAAVVTLTNCFTRNNGTDVQPFGVGEDVYLDTLTAMLFQEHGATNIQKVAYVASASSGAFSSGVLVIGSNAISSPGTITVTLVEATTN